MVHFALSGYYSTRALNYKDFAYLFDYFCILFYKINVAYKYNVCYANANQCKIIIRYTTKIFVTNN